MKKTILQISALPCPDLKLCTKGLKEPLNHSTSWTKGGHMDPELTSRECKGHPKLITTPIKPLPCFLGVPLLILPSPHPLLGHIHLNTILNQLLIRFILTLSHNPSGMHLSGVEALTQLSSHSFASTTYSTTTITSCSSKTTPNTCSTEPEPR